MALHESPSLHEKALQQEDGPTQTQTAVLQSAAVVEQRRVEVAELHGFALRNILERVNCDTGNQVLMCMEVCKEWHAAVQMTASKLSLINNKRSMKSLLTICKFESLRTLYIKDCTLRTKSKSKPLAFQALIGRCPQLIAIHFINVKLSTEDAASWFSHCSSLCTLELRNNGYRFRVPPLDHLTTLQSLTLDDRDYPRDPPPLHTLTRLTSLVLPSQIALLPPIHALSHLKSLQLRECSIQTLPPLHGCPFLQHLDVSYNGLLELVDLTLSPALESLIITRCRSLREIQGLEALTSLHTFKACVCNSLVPWPKLSNIQSLRDVEFDVRHNHQTVGLETLPRLQHLYLDLQPGANEVSLKSLRAIKHISLKINGFDNNHHLDILSSLKKLHGLHTLDVNQFHMELVDHIGDMRTLRQLEISNSSIRCLPNLTRLTQLQSIKLSLCRFIEEFPLLDTLANLTKLVFAISDNLRELPALDGTPNLQHLNLSGSTILVSLPPMAHLQRLTHLKVNFCSKLKSLPHLPTSLQVLGFERCKSLVRLPSLDSLIHLQYLNGSYSGIKLLPPLSGLISLQELLVSDCEDLVVVPTLGGDVPLRVLNVARCEKLKQLPPLGVLRRLRKVKLVLCPRLTNLQFLEGVCEDVEVVKDE